MKLGPINPVNSIPNVSRIDPDDKPKKPFTFIEKDKKEKAFTFVKDDINDINHFVINRLTDNGAYVKGGMLWFRINGVDVFTDVNHSIFVNKKNNSVVIKSADNLKNLEEDKVDPELRQYIILIYGAEDQDVYRWESMTGRTITYEYIRNNIEDIDPDKSIILTENVPIKDAFTVSQFVKYLKNGNLIEEDDFNIEYYSNGGYEE